MVFYVYGGTADYENSKTITSFFGLTTLGNLGSAYKMCNYGSSFTSTISLLCKSGEFDEIEVFGEEKADGTSSCTDSGDNLKVDSSCDYSSSFSNSEKTSLETAFSNQCVGKEV